MAKTALIGVFTTQLAFLSLRAREQSYRTPVSLAADILSSIATLSAVILTFLNYQRSLRSSTVLTLYLSASAVLGVARTRTLWLIAASGRVPSVESAVLGLTAVALLLECIERKTYIMEESKSITSEQKSGFWNRTCFLWLVATLRAGYSKIIALDDLPQLDTDLESHTLREELVSSWNGCLSAYPWRSYEDAYDM
jgi:ATP-binding cassette, subfamily C (CFTR/MRP), member 1